MSATRTRVLGSTQILRPLGKGGMAQVYHGVQKPLGRDVAVKVMLPQIAKSRDMSRRFRREGRILAALQHENIVAVYDMVEKNQQVFMIMEYVRGIDVDQVLADTLKLPLDVALIVALGVCRAIEHAHFRRVIHRDIKPSNVLLSFDGEVKLADFGIAREVHASDLTQSGQVLGTPSYLAPELFKGIKPDHRSDIYALGVLLFQMIAGQKPFNLAHPGGLYGAIAEGDRHRLRSVAAECPRAVEKIVERCLDLKPSRRWQRAADLRKELEDVVNKHVKHSTAARLVTFLYDRGYVKPELLATLDLDELAVLNPSLSLSLKGVSPPVPGDEIEDPTILDTDSRLRHGWGLRIALGVVALSGLVFALRWVAPEATEGLVDWIVSRVRALR